MADKPETWGDHAITATDLHAFPQEITYAGVPSFLRRPLPQGPRRRGYRGRRRSLRHGDDEPARHEVRARAGSVRPRSSSPSRRKSTAGISTRSPKRGSPTTATCRSTFPDPRACPTRSKGMSLGCSIRMSPCCRSAATTSSPGRSSRRHAARHGKPLSLIHFDAHSDTWVDENEDGVNHGTMFWHATRQGYLDPAASAQIGLRTVNEDLMGFNVFDGPWVHRPRRRSGRRGGAPASWATPGPISPSTSTASIPPMRPAPARRSAGGLTTHQAREILRGLEGLNIVGADLVEVSPPYDHAEITALAGATLAQDFLCLLARAPWRKG